MPFRPLSTPLGGYTVDECHSPRILIDGVQILGMSGCDPICEWDLDMQEVLLDACHAAGAAASCVVPGGWQISPASKLPAVERHLARLADDRAKHLAATGAPRRIYRS